MNATQSYWAVYVLMLGFTVHSTAVADDSLSKTILDAANARAGLCIHIGCGDGSFTASLAQKGRYIVHGLALDREQAQRARQRIQSLKLYGAASVHYMSLTRLPYADDLANLVVVDDLSTVLKSGGSLREMIRVLAPRGVAVIGTRADAKHRITASELRSVLEQGGVNVFEMVNVGGTWAKITKPRPRSMDEWTHARHGPDRNAVANDTLVQPPSSIRWIHGPLWRGTSGVQLSANGRNIYTDGSVRDAFNGLRVCSLRSPGKYKYVSAHLAVGDRVYLTAPRASRFLQAADVRSGKIVLTFDQIEAPAGLAYENGDLIFAGRSGTGCVEAATGKLKWLNKQATIDGRPLRGNSSLVLGDKRVFVQVPSSRRSKAPARLVCLNRKSGRLIWEKAKPKLQGELLLYAHGLVVCCDSYRVYPKRIYTYAAADGRFRWKSPPMNEGKSVGVYSIGGLIWCQHNRQITGFEPATGKVKQKHASAPGTFKCAQPAATTQYVSGGNLGFFDLERGTTHACRLDRNACGANPGVLFCNGLTYSFPKQCSCFSMIRGYTAFSSSAETLDQPIGAKSNRKVAHRRETGPAFSAKRDRKLPASKADWPAFRHDAQRSACTDAAVPLPLERIWVTQPEDQAAPKWLQEDWTNHPSLGGPVSSTVVSRGVLCVSLSNSHRVLALDPKTGQRRWTFTAGGRVLRPPMIAQGLCYFGSQDGWVYCVRADNGKLAWKFRAAPIDRRIVAFGQLESLWPVMGGVLVKGGRAYFTAGRMSNLAGGLVGYAVDARTGKLLWRAKPPTGYQNTQDNKIAPAYRNDVPVGCGKTIQLGHPRWIVHADTGEFARKLAPIRHRLVKPHPVDLLGSTRDGLTDLSRSRLQGPIDMGHGYLAQEFGGVWAQQLVIGRDRIYGFQLPTIRTFYFDNKQTQQRNPLRLVTWDRSYKQLWTKALSPGIEFVATIGAGRVLFATGTRRVEEQPYHRGMLWAYSTTDGTELAQYELDGLPSGEGLSAANGRLYVTMQDGRLICFGNR